MGDQSTNRKIFYASIINHNGFPALMIRKIITDKKIINELALDILSEGAHNFEGVLIFRNPIIAIRELEKKKLIDFKLKDILKFKYS